MKLDRANRSAVRSWGRAPLAGALYKVVSGPTATTLGAAAAIGGHELLDVRLTQLELGREPDMPSISRTSLVTTAIGLLLMTAGLVATLLAVVGPDAVATDSRGIDFSDAAGVVGCGGWMLLGSFALYRWSGRRPRLSSRSAETQ